MGRGSSGSSKALRAAIPCLVLAMSLAVTAAGWHAIERDRAAQMRQRFERSAAGTTAELRERVQLYEQVLRSGAARIASSPAMSESEWREFVAYLQLPERFPAMPAMRRAGANGPSELATPPQAAAVESAMRRIDTAISGKVHGVDAVGPDEVGFAMVVPVVRLANGGAPGPRAASVIGMVWGSIRIYDLLQAALDAEALRVLDLRIYDSAGVTPGRVLADTRAASGPAALFEQVVALPMPGRTWTLQYVSRPEFDAELERERPWHFAAAGLVASLLAFLLARRLMAQLEHARHLSVRDPLTGLFNRRYLEDAMDREMSRARRARQRIGLIVLDIDGFKGLNDTFGHSAGDHVLTQLAEQLRQATRGSDIACRFGGEEFALILPGAPLAVARERAEAIRRCFAEARFEYNGTPLVPVTLSAGVAELAPDDGDWARALHQADRALYTAKQAGRNRVLAVAAE